MVETWKILKSVLRSNDIAEQNDETCVSDIEEDNLVDEKDYGNPYHYCRRISLPARIPDIVKDSMLIDDTIDSRLRKENNSSQVKHDFNKPKIKKQDNGLPDFIPTGNSFSTSKPELLHERNESPD